MAGAKYKDCTLSDFIHQKNNLENSPPNEDLPLYDKVCMNLLLFIYCISDKRSRNKTSIQKLSFFAQLVKLFPFLPKTINHYGAYSFDIEYLIDNLITKGYLTKESYKIQNRTTDLLFGEREFTIYDIPANIHKKMYQYAEQLNIDLNEYKYEISDFCKKYTQNAKILGARSKNHFLQTIKQQDNHIFFDKSIIDNKLKRKFTFGGFDTVGWEEYVKIPVPIISKSNRTPAEIIGGIASEIVNNKA